MREKFQKFMTGRYGTDQLSRFLLGAGLALAVISMFWRKANFTWFLLVILIIVYYRMFSKDISRRYAENQKYLELTAKVRQKFYKEKRRIEQSKEYAFFKCPSCSQEVRVPRGKGKIEIDCPKCHTKFIKRS